MNTRRLFTTALAFIALASVSLAGQVGPYLYTFGSTPVDAPVTALNPPPGAVVIDTTTGVHYRKISAVGSNATYAVEPVITVITTTPLTGATITAGTAQDNQYNVITPAGTIAALTYAFPSNANSRIGQVITLNSSQIVTTLTLSKGGQTITNPAGTALAANVPQQWIKTAASTWSRISNVATDSGVVLTASVITDGLTASGSASNDFSSSTGTFKTSTGANTLGGAVSINDATTPSLTTATGKTNTGFVTVLGKTSGGLKLTAADSAAQTVTVSLAAQTSGAATLTIPDQAGVASSVSSCSTATLTAGATPAFTPKANISTYLLTPAEDETIAGTVTGAVAGKTYHIRVLTSGATSYTLTFGSNFKSTGTLATGVTTAKVFIVSFLYDGTAFNEVARTTAM